MWMMNALLKLWAFHAVLLFISCQGAEKGSHDVCDHKCLREETCHVKKCNNTCYYVFANNKRTWLQNDDLCNSNCLNMTKLHKETVHQSTFIGGFLKELNITYGWLGGNSRENNSWTFVNDKPFNLEPYGVDNRNRSTHHKCGVFELTRKGANHSQFDVKLDECYNDNHFICRFEDWRGKPSLYVSDVPANWFEARSRCMEHGGDLFYLKETENITIYKKHSFLVEQKFFIGLRHRIWRWADSDEIFHFNWRNREPNTYSERCINIYNDGTWNDDNCQRKFYATCQKDATNTNGQTKADVTKPASKRDEGNDLSTTYSYTSVAPDAGNKNCSGTCQNIPYILGVMLGLTTLTSISLVVYIAINFIQPKKPPPPDIADDHVYCEVELTPQNHSPHVIDPIWDIPDETEIEDNPIYGSQIERNSENIISLRDIENAEGATQGMDLNDTEIIDNPCYETYLSSQSMINRGSTHYKLQ